MVQVFLDCFRSLDHRETTQIAATQPRSPGVVSAPRPIECVHIDFRLSNSIEDIGRRRWSKLVLVLAYCVQAALARFRHGADILLYVPAPALRHAIFRDWLVMLCCRPFFRRRVFWWHATGLGTWLKHQANPLERWITRQLLGKPDLSLVLGAETANDARELASRRIALVPNAIPDPCPQLAPELVREKAARRTAQREWLEGSLEQAHASQTDGCRPPTFRLLFIGLCYREKGLFDAVEAVARVNRRLTDRHAGLHVQLEVAGRFFLEEEQREFEERIRQPDLQRPDPSGRATSGASIHAPAVRYHGFAAADAKDRLFQESDCLLFPTYYAAESFGLVLIEAMAHGMDVITTRWHNIPELFPAAYPGLVEPKDPAGLDAALDYFLLRYEGDRLRRHYEQNFALERFRSRIENAVRELNSA